MPMSTPYHHGNLRSALVQQATDWIIDGRLETLSLRQLAQAVGVSPAAVYHHFPDKSALLNVVVRETGLLLQQRLRSAAAAHPTLTACAALGATYVEFAAGNPALFNQLIGTDCEAAQDVQAESIELLKAALRSERIGSPLTDEVLNEHVAIAWAMSHGFATLVLSGRLSLPDALRALTSASALIVHDLNSTH